MARHWREGKAIQPPDRRMGDVLPCS